MIFAELDDWNKYYLPISLDGLTILDVGAGEGETAWFFLQHGAKKVICIEPDDKAFPLLLQNSEHNPLELLHKRFDLEDLQLEYDFMKMDIEGYEEKLLDTDVTKPCVIEIHGLQLKERFRDKGYHIVKMNHPENQCLSVAYKNL
jgi:predicted RNA methylase